jgi:hypothetical protein
MSNNTIFTLEKYKETNNNINMDELFKKKRERDLRELNLFKKILNRIHVKIEVTSKQKINEQFIWFLVPEFIIGYPKYDTSNCIAFLMDTLKENKFLVNYYHPNLLYIYWGHYWCDYMRTEVKKKFGIKIDELGNRVIEGDDNEFNNSIKQLNYNELLLQENKTINSKVSSKKKNEEDKKFTNINSYMPTNNIIYNKLLSNDN